MRSVRYIALGVDYIPADFITRPPGEWTVRTAPAEFFDGRTLPDGALTVALVRRDVPFPIVVVEDPRMESEVVYSDEADPHVESGIEPMQRLLDEHANVRDLVEGIQEKGRLD